VPETAQERSTAAKKSDRDLERDFRSDFSEGVSQETRGGGEGMSVKVMGKVFETDLEPADKVLLLALADHAHDDGTKIFPSVARMMVKSSMAERTVQRHLRGLVERGLLVVVNHAEGGRGHAVEYAIDMWRLTECIPLDTKGGQDDTLSPDDTHSKGAAGDGKGCQIEQERVPPVTPQPSGTVKEPSARARARRWRVLPPDEQLSEARIRIGLEAGLRSRSQVERQWLIFRGHEFATPRSDVDRTWQNWCLKEADWKADEVPPPGPPAADPEKAKRRQQADVEYEAAKERSRQRAREADREQAGRAQQATQRAPAEPERLGSVLSRLAAGGGKHADSA
jgi:hypothetical protein